MTNSLIEKEAYGSEKKTWATILFIRQLMPSIFLPLDSNKMTRWWTDDIWKNPRSGVLNYLVGSIV